MCVCATPSNTQQFLGVVCVCVSNLVSQAHQGYGALISSRVESCYISGECFFVKPSLDANAGDRNVGRGGHTTGRSFNGANGVVPGERCKIHLGGGGSVTSEIGGSGSLRGSSMASLAVSTLWWWAGCVPRCLGLPTPHPPRLWRASTRPIHIALVPPLPLPSHKCGCQPSPGNAPTCWGKVL